MDPGYTTLKSHYSVIKSNKETRPAVIVGNVYLERGNPVVVVTQWHQHKPAAVNGAVEWRTSPSRSPRNVAIRRQDGAIFVRPFRGLTRPATCRFTKPLTVSQETDAATLVAGCSLPAGHPAGHRLDTYCLSPGQDRTETRGLGLALAVAEAVYAVDPDLDKKPERYTTLVAANKGCCGCLGYCWLHPAECPCVARYSRGDDDSALLRLVLPPRNKAPKLPDPFEYDRPVPDDWSPIPPGLLYSRPPVPADPRWEAECDARTDARDAEIAAGWNRITWERTRNAPAIAAAVATTLRQLQQAGYVVTLTRSKQWRVTRDGAFIGTYPGVPLTPETGRSDPGWYVQHREQHPEVRRIDACPSCGRTTFGKRNRTMEEKKMELDELRPAMIEAILAGPELRAHLEADNDLMDWLEKEDLRSLEHVARWRAERRFAQLAKAWPPEYPLHDELAEWRRPDVLSARRHSDGCPSGSAKAVGGYWALQPHDRVEYARPALSADGSAP